MPVYAYRCSNCNLDFERMQRFSDAPITECPDCKAQDVKRVIQPVGIIFKGTGWYVKDSKAANSAGKPPDKGKSSDKETSDESVSDNVSTKSKEDNKTSKSSKETKSTAKKTDSNKK